MPQLLTEFVFAKQIVLDLKNNDMEDLEKLIKTQSNRLRVIATDGVFSMDGQIAKLNEIVFLAEKYDAMVMVDDHATGFIGPKDEDLLIIGVLNKIDIFTSTLGNNWWSIWRFYNR